MEPKSIILTCTSLLIIYQCFTFVKYFKIYVLEYLNGEKSTFNKYKDRWILVLSIILIGSSHFFYLPILKEALLESKFVTATIIILNIIVITLVLHLGLKRKKIITDNIDKKASNILLKSKFHFKSFNLEEVTKLNEQFKEHFENFYDSIKYLHQDQKITPILNCISIEKNKSVGYKRIFELLNEITKEGILDLFDEEREKFYKFILFNFKRDGEPIELENLKSAYCKWRVKNA